MEPKDNTVRVVQQLVDRLKREVAQKEAELAMLISHRTSLVHAFSTPTFPSGYVPSGSGDVENLSSLIDRSIKRPSAPDELGLSDTCAPRKRACNQAVSQQNTPPSLIRMPSSSPKGPSQDVGSESETSNDSRQTPNTTKDEEINQPTRSGESSESSKGKVLPSPVNKKSRNHPKFPVVNWTQQIGKRTATSSNGDSSTDSGDSISSDGSAHEGPSNGVEVENTRETATSAAPHARAVTQAQILSSDAPPEDQFDWEVLGVSGPWLPEGASGHLTDSSWSQHKKQQSQLSCKFQSIDEYRSTFENLIFEECKAHLSASWDMYISSLVEASQDISIVTSVPEDRFQESLWQFRPMYPSADDPFKYVAVEVAEGAKIRLDTSEVVLLTHNNTKSLAIATLAHRKDVLLRTRIELPAAGGQCALLRLVNVVTLKRQYVSLCRAMDLWDPLQQQLLDPSQGNNFGISAPSDSYTEEDVKMNSCTTVSAWKKERLLNKKQIIAVEAVLRLQQGFLLVQGPPGTGKSMMCMYPAQPRMGYLTQTSTIVGMISAVHIEEPGAKILVCASSNAAVDEIVSRLMHQMLDRSGKLYTPERGLLLRLGVEKSILPGCLPVSMDKVVQGNAGASNVSDLRREAVAGASIVCCTISGSGHQVFDDMNQKFDVLIVDEAAQALESEVLIALQRVKGRCVLVGDPCQLPAVVLQRPGKAYGRSLFERMQEAGQPAHLLTTQYRMHPLISQFPSATFYEGRLKDSPQCQAMPPIFKQKAQEMGIDICGYRFKLGAYCFLDVTWGVEKGEVIGHSLSNIDEAEVVATVVRGVVRSLKEGVEPNIGVITPYLAQRSIIMQNLERYSVNETACEVNTVDGFQGREKDVIILSCVRAQAEHGLGFVSDVRRMNVALTRARHALIIVGHAETLRSQSTAWNALLEDASARGLYQILCHERKPIRMGAGVRFAGGPVSTGANEAPKNANQRKLQQGNTPRRIETGHHHNRMRFEQRAQSSYGAMRQSSDTSSRQGTKSGSAAGQDLDQSRFELRASSATEGVQHCRSHIRFEEDADAPPGNLYPSNNAFNGQPLSVICGMAMSSGNKITKGDGLKRKANQHGTGSDQAEASNTRLGRQVKMKLEAEDPVGKANVSPAISTLPPLLPLPTLPPPPPPIRQMRGQVSDTREPSNPKLYYDRDNNAAGEFSEERTVSVPRTDRGKGPHWDSGRRNYKADRGDSLERGLSVQRGRVDDRNGSMNGNVHSREQPRRGRFIRRGKFNRSNGREHFD